MNMRLILMDILIKSNPIIIGFNDVNEVANYIANTSHSILLDGYLLYAYQGEDSVKSVVISTYKEYGKVMVSVMYDGYFMLHCGRRVEDIESLIEEFSKDKKLKTLYDSLINRFYGGN